MPKLLSKGTADVVMDLRSKLKRINDFIKNTMIPDAFPLAEAYPDYYEIGCRAPNLLEFGLFPHSEDGGKSTRYAGKPVEGGPLARLWIRGDYRRGISTMDRIVTRVLEAAEIGELMEGWLEELQPGEPILTPLKYP